MGNRLYSGSEKCCVVHGREELAAAVVQDHLPFTSTLDRWFLCEIRSIFASMSFALWLCLCLCACVLGGRGILTFHFETTIESQEVARTVQRGCLVPVTQFLPMITSYITIVQYQNQETWRWYKVCHFITCRESCNHNHDQDTELIHHQKGFSPELLL